jgi:hypothetical protein
MEDVGTFYGHLVYLCILLMYSWYNLWPFAIYSMVIWSIFPFWYVVPRTIWQPW